MAGRRDRPTARLRTGARVDAGFGWLDVDGAVDSAQPLQLWITTRMTHVFALGHLLGVPGCGPLADHGLTSIRHSFEDRDHGGWFAEAGPAGPTRTTKEAHSHAFVLLAASSAAIAGRSRGRAAARTGDERRRALLVGP